MIPVVLQRREHRPEAVEHPALNALPAEPVRIALRQGQKTADIVIEHPDSDALGRLFPQDVVDCIPHDAFLNDEKLQEDIPLRPPQFREQGLKHLLSGGKIPAAGMPADRKARPLQVGDLGGALRGCLAGGFIVSAAGKQKRPACGLQIPQPAGNSQRGGLEGDQQIEETAEYGEQEEQDNPQQLEGGLVPGAHHAQAGQDAEHLESGTDPLGQPAGIADQPDQDQPLHHQQQYDKDSAAQELEEPTLSQGNTSFLREPAGAELAGSPCLWQENSGRCLRS